MAASDPNFIVSSLPDYVKENQDFLIKEVVFGTPTVSRITPQTGIKTSAYINYLSAAPTLQDGKGCGFNAINSTTLTQRTIETALIKVNETFCPDTLLGKWAEYLVRIPETQRESLPFEAYIVRIFRDAVKAKIETLVWQGDKTQSSDADIKWINGFLKIALTDASVIDVAIAYGTSAWNSIKAVIKAVPAELIRKGNVKVFVSPELFLSFVLELVEKNLYHYSGPVNAAPEEIAFPGTNIGVVSTAGLAETNYILATTPDNMFYGTDVESAAEQFKVSYDDKTNLFYLAVRWNSGVQFAFPDRVVLGTIATS